MGTIAITVGMGSTPLPGPATAPPFARDTFTDTAGTLLQNHTPELGGPWVAHPSDASAPVISNANRVRNGNTGNGPWLMTAAPANADYAVSADLHVVTLISSVYLVGRADAAATTYYAGGYDGQNNLYDLFKFVAGAFTSLGQVAAGLAAGATRRLELRLSGTTIALLSGGVTIFSLTDSAISAAGKPGLRFSGLTGDTTGVHFDAFSAALI